MPIIKTVNESGQISLGEEFAGRTVMIEELQQGVWLIKSGEFIPDSERWLFEPQVKADVDEAIRWAESNPPGESDLLSNMT
ncbi:MAG: hypothetical protein GC154_14705 [bacterium]|nr:hypothetical protein [bacterium]